MVRYSFLVRLSHPLLHTGLSRRILDDFIRARKHVRRNGQADLLRRFEIDDKLKLGWLLDGKVGGLRAFQNLVHVACAAPIDFGEVGSIGHQATADDIVAPSVNRREPIFCREFRDPLSIRTVKRVPRHSESTATRLSCFFERTLEIVGVPYLHGMKLQTEF